MIVYIWCTLTLKSVGFQRNTHVIDGNTETISISNTLRKRKYANWKAKRRIWDAPNLGIGGQPKFLLIDIKYDLFSFSSLVMTQEKPLLVSLPNVLFHLDACLLPTDDPSPAAAGPAAASKHCWSRPPTDPRALLPGSQGTLWHILSLFLSTLGKGTCTQQPVGDDYKMHRLYCTGVLRVEKGILCTMLEPFYLERTQLTPTMISIICRIMLTLIPLSHLISKPWLLMCEVLRGASQTMSPNVLSHVVLHLG